MQVRSMTFTAFAGSMLLLAACGADMRIPAASSPEMAQLHKLLAALNSGDRATMEAYQKTNFSPDWKDPFGADQGLYVHKQLGGLDLLEVDKSLPNQVHGWVRARDSDAVLELAMDVEPEAPHRVTYLSLHWGNVPDKFRPARLSEPDAVKAWRDDTARRAIGDKFSGAILLMHGDKVLLREAYGYSHRENDGEGKVLNSVDTRFRTASTSKMFTAVAVMRLVQDGRLKLEDRIDKVVPALKDKPIGPATIHQLLTHTSCAGEFLGPRYEQHKQELNVHDDYVRVFGGDPLLCRPGERFEYHNLGYMYLGAAIEHASGKSYYDYVEEVVFKPAGMAQSDMPHADVDMKGRARGYMRPPGTREWVSAAKYLDYRADGAGGAWCTVDDVARFLDALRTNRLLDEKHTQLMINPKVEIWKGREYGFGVYIETYPWMGLSIGGVGGENGSSSEAWYMPKSGYRVVVLSNFDQSSAPPVSEFIRGRLPLR